ncbi:MAG: hypothetical protein M3Q50_03890, partial [Chloroflexota bacterium]|nr:hypothetical protein [Chloroflexota bacterium]
TEVFVDLSAIVTVVATRSYPITALVTARLDDAPDAGSGTSCVEKRQKKCREDPTVSDKSFCDSEKGKAVFKILCDLFGDPALTTPGGVTDVVIV